MDHEVQFYIYHKSIEDSIRQYLPPAKTRPSRLHSAMLYSLQAGGKRLRPMLVLAAQQLFEPVAAALPAAVAIECLHGYTLIHDDLPCMDDSELRRGKPACHMKYDEATAVLAGDALLTHAFHLLGTEYLEVPELAARLVSILGKAAGSRQLIGGQMEDIANEGLQPDPETLDYIHRNKTAALLTAALHMGAVLGNAEDDQIQRIMKLGECVGLAFQIVDDLLDQSGKKADIGKPVRADSKNAKTTYLCLHTTEEARKQITTLTRKACDLCESLSRGDSFLAWLCNRLANRGS